MVLVRTCPRTFACLERLAWGRGDIGSKMPKMGFLEYVHGGHISGWEDSPAPRAPQIIPARVHLCPSHPQVKQDSFILSILN